MNKSKHEEGTSDGEQNIARGQKRKVRGVGTFVKSMRQDIRLAVGIVVCVGVRVLMCMHVQMCGGVHEGMETHFPEIGKHKGLGNLR